MRIEKLFTQKLDVVTGLAQRAEDHGTAGDVSNAVADLNLVISAAKSAQSVAVMILRARGESWTQVGDALGISRQSAHKTYGP